MHSGADHCLLGRLSAGLSEVVSLEQVVVSGSVLF